MKLSVWAWALALSGCLIVGDATAQQLQQPFSVRPAGFDYNRYLQDGTPSPSDSHAQPAAPPVAAEAAMADEPAVTSEPAVETHVANGSGGCDTGCSSGACSSSCCGSSCGGCLECNLGDAFSIGSHLIGDCSPWSVGGWTQLGYHDESNGQFNDNPGKLNLQQQWAWIEREAKCRDCRWDWGFRADIMYGIDSQDTQAFGNPLGPNGNPQGYDNSWDNGANYGWALPQLYAELARGDFSVKVGHFYTIIGYEVVQAPDNFFYSHSYTMYNSEPFTHSGALATYNVNDSLEVYFGWTIGWDTGFDQFGGGNNFLGGFSATLTDDVKFTYATTAGDFGSRGSDGYMHSIVFDVNLTERLNYVFQSDMLQADAVGGGAEDNVGINQYLIYKVNDCVGIGGRLEWWKTDPLVAIPALGNGNNSWYEATFGVNLRPHANFVVRPEIRQDWIPATGFDQTIFGIDVVATY